ncbi:MAG: hypothetical protein JO332_12170 [Planctomycetaceae bacterium]|nr:hypothetical protein [Planctomycetaceae bacterium]
MRHVSILVGLVLALGLAACSSGPSDGAAAGDCCKKTAELKAQIPKCCSTADSSCCAASKSDPSKKAECCAKAEAINAKLPECCKKAAAGEAQACCTKK